MSTNAAHDLSYGRFTCTPSCRIPRCERTYDGQSAWQVLDRLVPQRTKIYAYFTLNFAAVLLGTLPRVLLLPFAGSVADRFNRRAIMILADTGNALLTLTIFLLLRADNLQLWHIYVIAALGAVFSAFQ